MEHLDHDHREADIGVGLSRKCRVTEDARDDDQEQKTERGPASMKGSIDYAVHDGSVSFSSETRTS